MSKVRVLVLRTAGTNCDIETKLAFEYHGADTDLVHINELIKKRKKLADYQILCIPGGFTYGDDITAGKILANELKYKLKNDILQFIKEGKLIIGICNGFQVLVKSGFLPGNARLNQEASLIINDSGKFEDRWVYLRATGYGLRATKCIWTKDLPEIVYLPVAHAEGKFVVKDNTVLERLKNKGQIVFRYSNSYGRLVGYPYNPNGSLENIAGICDETGRIFGLMPHPERHAFSFQHPQWRRSRMKKETDGAKIFKNGVIYAKKYLS